MLVIVLVVSVKNAIALMMTFLIATESIASVLWQGALGRVQLNPSPNKHHEGLPER